MKNNKALQEKLNNLTAKRNTYKEQDQMRTGKRRKVEEECINTDKKVELEYDDIRFELNQYNNYCIDRELVR